MTQLKNAILVLKKVLIAGGAKLTEDSVWGPKTLKALEDRLAADAKIDAAPKVPPVQDTKTPIGNVTGINFDVHPWMDWMKKHEGGSEHDPIFNKFMSAFWKLSGLNYTTIEGASHAWCALTVNAALHESGYKGNGRADAVSFEKYGVACGFVKGAIIPMRHVGGSHHVTFFDHWADEKNKVAACLGGNQGDHLKISNFNLSGNSHGHDECVSGPRWPIKAV